MLFQKEPGSACCPFVTVLTETLQSGRGPPQHRLASVLRLGQSTELARGGIVMSKRQYLWICLESVLFPPMYRYVQLQKTD